MWSAAGNRGGQWGNAHGARFTIASRGAARHAPWCRGVSWLPGAAFCTSRLTISWRFVSRRFVSRSNLSASSSRRPPRAGVWLPGSALRASRGAVPWLCGALDAISDATASAGLRHHALIPIYAIYAVRPDGAAGQCSWLAGRGTCGAARW